MQRSNVLSLSLFLCLPVCLIAMQLFRFSIHIIIRKMFNCRTASSSSIVIIYRSKIKHLLYSLRHWKPALVLIKLMSTVNSQCTLMMTITTIKMCPVCPFFQHGKYWDGRSCEFDAPVLLLRGVKCISF